MIINKINFNTPKASAINCQPLKSDISFRGELGNKLNLNCDSAPSKNHLGNKLNMMV
jgi:hypothetical protein